MLSKKAAIIIFLSSLLCSYLLISIIYQKTSYASYTLEENYNTDDFLRYYREFKEEFSTTIYPDYTKADILNKAKKAVQNEGYIFLNEKPLKAGAAGITNITLRIIKVDPALSDEEYAICCVHELIHLKYYTLNETFTQFMTFVTMYESDDAFLHKASLRLAMNIFAERYPDVYNCVGNIIKYMEGKNNV